MGDADFGAATEFHVSNEKHDGSNDDTALEEREDDHDSKLVQKRLFPSNSAYQKFAIEEAKEDTTRSKSKGSGKSRKRIRRITYIFKYVLWVLL